VVLQPDVSALNARMLRNVVHGLGLGYVSETEGLY